MPANHSSQYASSPASTTPCSRQRAAASSRNSSGAATAVGLPGEFSHSSPRSAHGLDAINLGPGDPRYAHAVDEQIDGASLERTFRALQRFALGSV